MRQPPYSYRSDPAVPKFDDSQPLLIFDGLCVLCSSGVQWMLARDPKGVGRFAVIQSPIPRALYAHYGLDADRFDTFMVLSNGVAAREMAGPAGGGAQLAGALALAGPVGLHRARIDWRSHLRHRPAQSARLVRQSSRLLRARCRAPAALPDMIWLPVDGVWRADASRPPVCRVLAIYRRQ